MLQVLVGHSSIQILLPFMSSTPYLLFKQVERH